MKKTILSFAAFAFLLCSCDQVGELSDLTDEQLDELSAITFKFNADLWGTEKPLEPGDQIGLFASIPINADNVLATVSQDGSLKCSETVRWNLNTSSKTGITFTAYTPYSSSYANGTGTFSVKADQSTSAGVKASDLMVASTTLSSRQNPVTLNFSHRMVRLALYFDNRSKYEIESVTVSNVITGVSLDLTKGNVNPSADAGYSITAGMFESSASKTYYSVIIAPQSSSRPLITVALSEGMTKTFILDSQQNFSAGQQWDNAKSPLVIDNVHSKDEEEPVEFPLTVNDWNDGDTMNFKKQ